jgi:hypothetical protein
VAPPEEGAPFSVANPLDYAILSQWIESRTEAPLRPSWNAAAALSKNFPTV